MSRAVPPSSDARATMLATLAPLDDAGSDLWSRQLRYVGVAGEQSSVNIVGPQDVCRGIQLVQGGVPGEAVRGGRERR